MSSSSNQDKQLLYAIIQHLENLKSPDVDAEQLKIAVANLKKATNISEQNKELALKAKNGSAVTLKNLWDVAITVVPTSTQSKVENETDLIPPDLREKFTGYLAKLKGTSYFQDVEPNTPAYEKRVKKAKEKFLRKYGAPEATEEKKSALPTKSTANAESISKAEALKNQGNERLKEKDYVGAIDFYSQAIRLHPTAVYYSNRAAARQYLNDHQLALEDAEASVLCDANFFKGYMRIGHSLVALKRYQDAIDCGFAKALQLQPNDAGAKESLEETKQLIEKNKTQSRSATNNNNNFDNNNNNNNNNMAGMAGLLNNPALAQMAEQMRATGQMPSMGDFMNNPGMMQAAMQAMQDPNFMQAAQTAMQNPDIMNALQNQMGNNNNARPKNSSNVQEVDDDKN